MQKRILKNIIAAAVMLSVAVTSSVTFSAEDSLPQDITVTAADAESGYEKYSAENAGFEKASDDIVLAGSDCYAAEGCDSEKAESYEGEEKVLLWQDGEGSVTWQFNVAEAGLYNFGISFLPLKSGPDIEYGLKIDGAVPFEGAESLRLTRDWTNATEEPRSDRNGNEIAPEQTETGEFVFRYATDTTGVETQPYLFAVTAGQHTVTVTGNGYAMAVASVGLYAPEKIENYSDVSSDYSVEEENIEPIIIQAEDASLKTDNSLIPKALNGNAGMTPVDPFVTKINCIGGTTWQSPGQMLTWDFTVKKAGYYRFGARYKQSDLVNGDSLRYLRIDGKTPFSEAEELAFPYSTGWEHFKFGSSDEPYYIWLDEGKHTVSLDVTLGEMADYYYRLNNIVTMLGDMYLKIVMITGELPDVNRDYELFRQIPDFTEVLTEAKNGLEKIVSDMETLTGNRGSQYTAAMNNSVRVISQMLDAPYIAHIYVKDYYTTYTTLSSWLSEMKNMPLTLDEIRFAYAGSDFGWDEPNILERFWFGLKRLIGSYTEDYNTGSADSSGSIKLWVNWGRDQTMVLDSLIRESFTADTGIEVELQIVSNSLINGLLADNFPDVQLHLERTAPVNYGIRGALQDLTVFDDYGEVLERFMEGADTPYWYDGELYALPDQQTFYCMFYRTDIFEQLGLTVPETWDEFLDCATVLQRYNMSVCVSYTQIASSTTVNSGIGSLNLFPTLLMQNGISLYNEELNATAFNTSEGINVFKQWTEMYSDYGYLKEADFYNRFRNGSMPLGISAYTNYMTLYSAAPEIQGRWEITNVPGTAGGNDYIAGGGTGCAIVKRSDNKEAAWEFLKWWTSAETQTRYSGNVESILGMLGRIPTSNVEAFKNLSWDPDDIDRLMNQWEKVREVPEVPGSYYLSRAVDQAYWSVLNDNTNCKDAVNKWSMVADEEISRKIKEYR